MRRLLAIPLLVLLAGCASPVPDAPTVATGQIDGAVVDELLRPFANHPVFLLQRNAVDHSSPLGGFTFRDVPVGTYTLLASRDGYRSATAVLDVQADKITRVILQLTPIPSPAPYFVTIPHRAESEFAAAGNECRTCSWDIPIEGRPREVVLEAAWSDGLATNDELSFEVTDDQGMILYRGLGTSSEADPFSITIDGADLRQGATRLEVHIHFGPSFTPRPRFVMDEVATFYYGATRDAMFFL